MEAELTQHFQTTDSHILNKLKSIAQSYGLTAEALSDHWGAHSTNYTKFSELNIANLERMEKNLTPNVKQQPKASHQVKAHVEVANDSFGNFSGTEKASVNKKRSREESETKLPPCVSDPYMKRSDSGGVEVNLSSDEKPTPGRTSPVSYTPLTKIGPQRYMYHSMIEMEKTRFKRIKLTSSAIANHYELENVTAQDHLKASQESVIALGQIDYENNDKVFMLKMENYSCKLDLLELKEYSLFPGQIVCAKGRNPYGTRLIVEEFWSDVGLPKPTSTSTGGTKVVVANGPFTTTTDVSYQPLIDLLQKHCAEKQPEALVLMGPFVDAQHPSIRDPSQLDLTYEDLFKMVLDAIQANLPSSVQHVVLVPSPLDVHHPDIFPQPTFSIVNQYPKFRVVNNPSSFELDGVTFGVVSSDVLANLVGKTTTMPALEGEEKVKNAVQHVIAQGQYYPAHPYVDSEQSVDYVSMTVLPDVLLFSSSLQRFVLPNCGEGVLAVNPGKLTRAVRAGTFAELVVEKGEQLRWTAQVIKL